LARTEGRRIGPEHALPLRLRRVVNALWDRAPWEIEMSYGIRVPNSKCSVRNGNVSWDQGSEQQVFRMKWKCLIKSMFREKWKCLMRSVFRTASDPYEMEMSHKISVPNSNSFVRNGNVSRDQCSEHQVFREKRKCLMRSGFQTASVPCELEMSHESSVPWETEMSHEISVPNSKCSVWNENVFWNWESEEEIFREKRKWIMRWGTEMFSGNVKFLMGS
jgi:hypothetical protein